MRQSEYENTLIYLWLARLQSEHRVFNVDNSHVCHAALRPVQGDAQLVETSRRAPPAETARWTIVQPFVCAPHFYGCTVCGRYHFCHLDERDCDVVVDEHDQLTCRHSRRLLRQSTQFTVANHDDSEQFDREARRDSAPAILDESARAVCGKTRGLYKAATRAYTNSHVRTPFSYMVMLEEREMEAVLDEEFKQSRKRRRQLDKEEEGQSRVPVDTEIGGDDADGAGEQMVVEEVGRGHKNVHDNRAYWNEYFHFLFDAPPVTALPALAVSTPAPTPAPTGVRPVTASVVAPLDEETRRQLEETLREVVSRLCRAHSKKGDGATLGEEFQHQALAHLLRPVTNVMRLVRHMPEGRAVATRPLCLALVLCRLIGPFEMHDAHGLHVQIWHRHPWLGALQDEGVVDSLLYERRRNQPTDLYRGTEKYDRTQLKSAVTAIDRALMQYDGYAFWLRDYVLNNCDD